jgi:2-polyprenyl-6-methoxyphenol hydroxylase-like FAD-dependent oxidoreductase
VTDLIVRDGRVAGVFATTADGRSVELDARLVIGADGISSVVGERVGATFSRVAEHMSALTYAHWPDLATSGYEWSFFPDACSGVIPTDNGETCVFVSGSAERIGRGGFGVINDILATSAPELAARIGAARPPRRAHTWTGQRGYLRQSHGPGWALVGESGHLNDPVSPDRFTDAVREAELLARAVIEGFDQPASLDKALQHYQSIRDRLSGARFDVVDRIASQRWDDGEISHLLMQLNSTVADEVEALVALGPLVMS